MSPPLVTLFVMTWKHARHVAAAMESAFAQTWPNLEILVSDDASPDGTWAEIERVAAGYAGPHRLRLNRNPTNLGILAHVNRVFELAEGRFLVHAAGDDVSDPERVARLAGAWLAGEGRVTAVHSAWRDLDEGGREGPIGRPAEALRGASPTPFEVAVGRINCVGATAGWDRRVFDRFGPLPAARRAVEDGPLFFRASLLGEIAYLDAPLLGWRTEGESGPTGLSPGWDRLRGNHVTVREWVLTNAASALADMARLEAEGGAVPHAEEIRAALRRDLARFGFEVRVARMDPWRRLAYLPRAAVWSLRARSSHYLAETLRQVFAPLWASWYDRFGPGRDGRVTETRPR